MRMKHLLSDLIFEAQKAFVPSRQILDNQVIAHEMMHFLNSSRSKKGYFLLKVDLSKAFDRMDWEFLRDCLNLYGFPTDYTNLIFQCILTSSLVVEINGQASGFFKPSKGLRQGCPLSPYLFIIGTNILSFFFKLASTKDTLKGIRIA
ncbi:secreted RxLR effector protein 78-like [Typha angustifolia]|uniref:secreted RxLR effector protein 78-like n=1 Tax=Typha angustifolia TaxID=59011 RepID=UPI003C2D8C69